MKKLWPLLFVLLIGCISQKEIIHEDTIYVTRKYIGTFDSLVVSKKLTTIYTSQEQFNILGCPELWVPPNVRCYLRYIPERLPNIMNETWVLYFTWDGTADLFKLRQNIFTGEAF